MTVVGQTLTEIQRLQDRILWQDNFFALFVFKWSPFRWLFPRLQRWWPLGRRNAKQLKKISVVTLIHAEALHSGAF